MGVEDLDNLVNTAGLATFGEPVVFVVSAVQKPARAIYQVPVVETEYAGVPVTTPAPVLLMTRADLVAVGAKPGDLVTVRGKRFRVLDGHQDPIEDAGGMMHVPICADPEPDPEP